MAEILPNSPNDVASRGVTNTTLAQFKGLARQVVINVDDGFRPVIMDGLTLGGKFFCASKAEVEAVKTTANNALTKAKADGYYLGKSAKAVSAGSADTATSAGKWTTARTLTLAGGATGSVSIDGSTNITLNVTSIAGAKVTGTVPSATTANTAHNAIKATQDASGNVITSTYATKAETVRSINNTRPDKNGNITPAQTGCLPLSGGTITGEISFSRGGQIRNAGASESRVLALFGIKDNFNSSSLFLSAENNSNPNFELQAGNGNTIKKLMGKVDGSLQWDGKEVERVDSSGTTWIRFDSGLQICFGKYSIASSDSNKTISFPKPFNTAPRIAISSSTAYGVRIIFVTSAKFESSTDSSATTPVDYIAIGYWK